MTVKKKNISKTKGRSSPPDKANNRKNRLLKLNLWKCLLVIFLGLFSFSIGYFAHLSTSSLKILKNRMEGKRFSFPSKIYSLASTIYPGMILSKKDVIDKCIRLGYKETKSVLRKGEFSVKNSSILIFTHDFRSPTETLKAKKVKLIYSGDTLAQIKDISTNKGLSYLELEPELLDVIYGIKRESRKFVPYSKIPQYLIDAIISTEDKRFYKHFGIDPRSILRALYVNIKAGKIVQGGSTVTQQLAKNFFLTSQRTIKRKVAEAVMALLMEYHYSKRQILECYFNEVYWGQKGSIEIHGIGEAAKYYFNKEPTELSLAECAVLSAIIKGPQIYSPYRNMKKALRRRNQILHKMRREGFIDEKTQLLAQKENITLAGYTILPKKAPYFIDFLKQQLVKNYSKEDLEMGGLRIFTTMNYDMQILAEKVLKRGLLKLESKYSVGKNKINGCILVMQPQTGYVMALVGGREYFKSQFNRAVQARRQVGSIFKPIVYLSAILSKNFTAASVLSNTPLSLRVKGKIWKPKNFSKRFSSNVLLRKALEKSLNVPTVRLGNAVGFDAIFQTARNLGIKTKLPRLPSIFLGAVELSPLEILSAYSTIANYGVRTDTVTIKKVTARNNTTLEKRVLKVNEGVSEDAAFITISLLEGIINEGTGRDVRKLGFKKEAAGKTGTTSNYRDAWFVGFTPDLLCLVWVGRDDNKSIELTGAKAALPIWTNFMLNATKKKGDNFFISSDGVVIREIDEKTGLLASKGCPVTREEYFIEDNVPEEYCRLHPLKSNTGGEE